MLDPQGRGFRVLLGSLSMVSSLAVDMSLPALPALVASLGTSAASVQLTISFYLIGYAAGQLFYGPLSDRFGRRPMLLTGMAIYTTAAFFCAIAPTIETIVVLRLMQGLGGCVGVVVTRAAARDYFSGPKLGQLLSSVTAVQAFGPLVAPVIGGILVSHFDWRAIFVVQGGFAAAVLYATWKGFGESLPNGNPHALRPRHLLANYYTFFSNPRCIGSALVSACVFAGLFTVLSASPFVLIDLYGLSSEAFGFFFGLSVLGYMIGAFANRRLLHRGVPGKTLLTGGLVILVTSAFVLLFYAATRSGGVAGIMVPYFAYCVALSLVQPNAIAAGMEPVPHMAGTGASLMGAIQMASGAAAGYVVNLFFHGTATPMGIGVAVAALGAAASYYFIARR
jgi:DHA1 family bicyclomycin/chloramphenicol resistance-like MFS transporter